MNLATISVQVLGRWFPITRCLYQTALAEISTKRVLCATRNFGFSIRRRVILPQKIHEKPFRFRAIKTFFLNSATNFLSRLPAILSRKQEKEESVSFAKSQKTHNIQEKVKVSIPRAPKEKFLRP